MMSGVNDERAAEGVDHLQRAAREMVAAARSFLDVVEELVEDRTALAEVAAAVGGVASTLGEAVRTGLGGRPAPWEAAAWGDPPFEDDTAASGPPDAEAATDPAGPDADAVADPAAEADDGPEPVVELRSEPRTTGSAPVGERPSRVRRISVD
jgi:hypothetical protein